jgi:hypothetical protein
MRVLIAAFGSRGGVQPMPAPALALRERARAFAGRVAQGGLQRAAAVAEGRDASP